MSDNEMLKPCPFCGGEAELITKAPEAYVHCLACSATSDSSFVPGHAAKQWNRRAAASAEPAQRDLTQAEEMLVTQALFASGHSAPAVVYSNGGDGSFNEAEPDAEIVAALEQAATIADRWNELGKPHAIGKKLRELAALAKAKGGAQTCPHGMPSRERCSSCNSY